MIQIGRKCLLTASVLVVSLLSASGQQRFPLPAFEVATIKPAPADTNGPIIVISPGTIELRGFTLKDVIGYAYWIHTSQVQGAKGWMDSEKFDIRAKPEEGHTSEDALRQMTQTLLADRFQLKFHHDTKEISAYVLLVDKNGPKLKARRSDDGGPSFRLVFNGPRLLHGQNSSIARLAFVLQARVLDRPVLDKTGLTGNFDFDLAWSANEAQPEDLEHPDIFTAVREQLGLRLEPQKDPVDALVIDEAKQPAEN